MYTRFVASILALAAGAAGVVVVVLLLRSVPGPASQLTTNAPSSAYIGPVPSSEATV